MAGAWRPGAGCSWRLCGESPERLCGRWIPCHGKDQRPRISFPVVSPYTDDMLQVAGVLEGAGVDAIEMSGGTVLGLLYWGVPIRPSPGWRGIGHAPQRAAKCVRRKT